MEEFEETGSIEKVDMGFGPNKDIIEIIKEILNQHRQILEAINRPVIMLTKPKTK